MIACLTLCACRAGDGRARAIRDATVPAGETTPSFDVARREGMTLRYAWQFTTPSDWKAYAEWVTGRLERQGFRRAASEKMTFTRYDGADHYAVEFARGEPEQPTRVLVTLTIMPD